jgi:hypothetical protein
MYRFDGLTGPVPRLRRYPLPVPYACTAVKLLIHNCAGNAMYAQAKGAHSMHPSLKRDKQSHLQVLELGCGLV